MTWVEGQNRAFLTLVKIVRCDVVYRTVDFGLPSFFYRLYSTIPTYKLRTYLPKSTIFSSQNGLSSLAVKLLKKESQ